MSATILIVDDNAVNQTVLIKLLSRRSDWAVLKADDGLQAVKSVKENQIDLVLMDISMPVLDGVEATKRIREWEQAFGRDRIPIVALTAHSPEEWRWACIDAGMDDYLTKPVLPEVLIETITKLLPYQVPNADTVAESINNTLLRLSGDKELLRTLAESFISSYGSFSTDTERALEEGDIGTACERAKELRSSLRNFTMSAAIARTVLLEEASRRGDIEEARRQSCVLEGEISPLIRRLKRLMPHAADR